MLKIPITEYWYYLKIQICKYEKDGETLTVKLTDKGMIKICVIGKVITDKGMIVKEASENAKQKAELNMADCNTTGKLV